MNMETGEIDTGGHPVGTQAAANHVADRKLAEMKSKQTAGPDKSKDYAMLKAFGDIKKQMGSEAYYVILGNNGYEHANEITNADKARAIYKEMAGWLKSAPKQPDPAPVQEAPGQQVEMWPEGRD